MKNSSEEFPFNGNESNESVLIDRYESMLSQGEVYFYDVDEFEEIIEHYTISNELQVAFNAVDMAKSQHPQSLTFMLKEAELLAYSNRAGEALKTIENLELLEASNTEIYITKASILSQQGKYKLALGALEYALTFAPDNIEDIYMSMAFEYQNLNKFPEAIDILKKVLALDTSNEDALYEIAYCFDITNFQNNAIEFFKNYIDENPYSSHGWYNLGNSYSGIKNFDFAIKAYDYCIVIDEMFSSAYFNKANIYAKQDKYLDAIDVYQQCLDLEQGGAITYFYMAECYFNMNSLNKALLYYKKAVAHDDKYSEAWMGMGETLAQLNRFEEAAGFMEKSLSIDELNPENWLAVAETYEKINKSKKALDAYAKALDIDNNFIDAYIESAEYYFAQGYTDHALDSILTGIENNPEAAELYYRLAAFQLELGKKEKGLTALQFALELNHDIHVLLFEYFNKAEYIDDVVDLIEINKK